MDSKKIGEFIAQQRKEKHLTQKQLGDVLGISDKTVSKWECGNGLPDISIIMPLCELLDTNVNELLSGERLTQDTYPGKAEENMIHLIQTQDNKNRKRDMIKRILSSIIWILMAATLLVCLLTFNGMSISVLESVTFYLDMVGMLEVMLILLCSLFFAGQLRDFKNAFVFLLREAESIQKLEDSITAVTLAEKALFWGGMFCSIFYIIQTLTNYDALTVSSPLLIIGMNMGVSLLTLFYGLAGVMILAPVKSRLLKKAAHSNRAE